MCVPTKYLPANSKILSKEEYKIALNCSQLSFSPSSVSNLLSVRDSEGIGIQWDASQMRYLDKKYETEIKLLTPNASSAERILETFENRCDVDYMYVTFHPKDGLLLLKGNQRNKLRKDRALREENVFRPVTVADTSLYKIYNDQRMGEDKRLLVIFIFASSEESRSGKLLFIIILLCNGCCALSYFLFVY